MKLARTVVIMAFISVVIAPSVQNTAPGRDGAAAYSLTKIKPAGFGVYQGILDWVPISSTRSIAFARNRYGSAPDFSIRSFVLSKTGAVSSFQTIGTGMGTPRAAAALWIESGAAADAAGPYGLVFVLFEIFQENPFKQTNSVRAAKFNASGKRIGAWRELLRFELGKNEYFSDEDLFACRGPNSIGVSASGTISTSGPSSDMSSRLYFLEASLQDGALVGAAVPLTLPEPTRDVEALASRPSWTGTAWLVPATATVYKKGGGWETVLGNRALVYSVSSGTPRRVVRREVARDAVLSPGTYAAPSMAPFPGTAGDQLLFVRHRKPIPENQRNLDMFQYDYSLKRLDASGKVLESTTLTLPAPAHKLAYDPAYEFQWEWDEWSESLDRNGKLYLSQCRSLEIFDSDQNYKYEQQLNFFEIEPRSGAVEHRARAVTVWNEVLLFQPLIDAFPGGPIAVVNRAYHTPSPYAWDNYITRFGD